MKFKCSGCGGCCRKVNRAVEETKHLEGFHFPFKWDETGRCEMLTEDNKCSVYEDRPLLCNVEKISDFLGLDKKKFYKLNNIACNELMDELGIDLYYRV